MNIKGNAISCYISTSYKCNYVWHEKCYLLLATRSILTSQINIYDFNGNLL